MLIAARMRSGASWSDVSIRNVSARGVLLNAKVPPAAGDYIEIRCGTIVIIGRTVWSKAPFFGIRAQDRIDIKRLINEPRLNGRPAASQATDAVTERRAAPRKPSAPSIAQRFERSRQLSSAFEFGLLILVALTIACIAASQVYQLLAKPFSAVASTLAQ